MKKEDPSLWCLWKKQVTPLKKKDHLPPSLPSQAFSDTSQKPEPSFEKAFSSRPLEEWPSRYQKCSRRPSIEKRLDLHGDRLSEAQNRVQTFLEKNYQQGVSCVLIITGKGLGRQAEEKKATIRSSLPLWLNALPHMVKSFSQSKQKDGGEGAFYVFLKKNKLLKQ
jgi:DNA-nicking Smr family endonuclease